MTPVRALVEESLKASFKKYLNDFGNPLNFQKLREAQMEMRIELDEGHNSGWRTGTEASSQS